MTLLKIVPPKGEPRDQVLEEDEFLVGRSSSCDLSLDDRWLSRRHARIYQQDSRYHVEDLGSRNGTFVNELEISSSTPLSHGDVIRVGDLQLHFLEGDSEAVQFSDTAADFLVPDQTVRLDTSGLDFKRYRTQMGTGKESEADSDRLWPVLNDAAAALIAHHPLPQLVETILDLVFQAVPAERGAIMLRDTQAPEGLRLLGQRAGKEDGPLVISRSIADEVIKKETAVLTLDASMDSRFEGSESVQLQGLRSLVCAPLWNQQEVMGLLYVDARLPGRPFGQDDLRLLGLLANMAAVKLENVRLVEAELESKRLEEQLSVASLIQRKLLPEFQPQPKGYELTALNRSCYAIGGDTYDLLERDDGRLSLVIADVAGKGVPAALLMAVFQVAMRTLVRMDTEPVALAQELNQIMADNTPANKFVTAFYGELDPASHRFTYVNAGHNPPVLLKRDSHLMLDATGPVLGVLPGASYQSRTVDLEPGDLLCQYTDGVTEEMNPEGEEFGDERLIEFLEQNRQTATAELPELLLQRMGEFSAGADRTDDTTLVLLRRL